MPGCARHRFLCAFTGDEPGLCPVCHRSWHAIETCPCLHDRSVSNHLRWHTREGKKRARKNLRRAGHHRKENQ